MAIREWDISVYPYSFPHSKLGTGLTQNYGLVNTSKYLKGGC